MLLHSSGISEKHPSQKKMPLCLLFVTLFLFCV
mgnify:CR=1 FL=1